MSSHDRDAGTRVMESAGNRHSAFTDTAGSFTGRIAELLVELGVEPGDDPVNVASAYLDAAASDDRLDDGALFDDALMLVKGSAFDAAMFRLMRLAFTWKFGRSPTASELSDSALMQRTCRELLERSVTLPDGARRTLGELTPNEYARLSHVDIERALER